ncbi:BspA family leucine-rich repeat surface protein, partial [Candidatus Woesearchaeota archaeon]|nr:BspA family leucine-rich repeat surface protein [Candidatus Woesearchaeota archaeon]
SVTWQDLNASEIILCNADNSILDNISINGSSTFTNNGLYMFFTDDSLITNSTIIDTDYGVYLRNFNNISLVNNTISGDGAGGILMNSGSNVSILQNNISSYLEGLRVYSSAENVTISDNILSSNGRGIRSEDARSSVCLISNNIISSYSTAGISLTDANNHLITNNSIYSSDGAANAMSFSRSSNNTLIGNNIDDSYGGLSFSGASHNNTLQNNTISNVSSTGMALDFAQSSGIYPENNLFDNLTIYAYQGLPANGYIKTYGTLTSDNNFTNLRICEDTTNAGCITWDFLNISEADLTDDNLMLDGDFVSLNTSDVNATQFNKSANITINTTTCDGLTYYNASGFPENKANILSTGTTFTPSYSTCANNITTFAVDHFSGYAILEPDEPLGPCVNLSDPSTYRGKVVNVSNDFYVNDNIVLCRDTYVTTGDMITINASDINLDCNGSTLVGDQAFQKDGIYIYYKTNVNVTNCTVTNFSRGITTHNSNIKLTNNTLQDNIYQDVLFVAGDTSYCNNIIENNTGSGNLPIYYANSSVYWNNLVASEIILCNADNSILTNITMNGSEELKNNWLYAAYSDNISIHNSSFSNNYMAIVSSSGTNWDVVGNFINGSGDSGMQIFSSENISITGNLFYDSIYGIQPGSSSQNITVAHNTFTDCQYPISSSSGLYYSLFLNNTILENQGRAISLNDGSNNQIIDNNLSGTNTVGSMGFWFSNSFNNSLRNNIISNYYYGMYLRGTSENNTINDTLIDNSSYVGVYFTQISGNYAIKNKLYNTTILAGSGYIKTTATLPDENNFTNLEICKDTTNTGCINWAFLNISYADLTNNNLLLYNDFVSLNASNATQFSKSANITINTSSCDNLTYYNASGFPENRTEILTTGTTFTPSYSTCANNITTFSVDHFSGYAVDEASEESNHFIFRINTTASPQNFSFQVDDASLTVNWGDGNTTDYNGTVLLSHNYTTAGIYNISVNGTASRLSFSKYYGTYTQQCTPELLNDILTPVSDGVTGIISASEMFAFTNITNFTATDFFDITSQNVTNLDFMFSDAVNFNQDLSGWNVSNVMTMSFMFSNADSFNENISTWDVSSVTDMRYMFWDVDTFNQSISNWDVSSVTQMDGLFSGAEDFNQDLGAWNVSNVLDMQAMFRDTLLFNNNISSWDVSAVTNMNFMFYNAPFNQSIANWDVSNVTTMQYTFGYSDFNQNISAWDVSNVIYMSYLFKDSDFNQDLGAWNVSNVISMSGMFTSAPFNQNISAWDVSNVTDMRGMFYSTPFNWSIANWDVSKVEDMEIMFYGTPFNQSISDWNVSSVTDMKQMFFNSDFNQNISGWDVSSVQDMSYMFRYSDFNQDIGAWDVSNVTTMTAMLGSTPFDQNISGWNVSLVTNFTDMFEFAELSTENYDALLTGWASLPSLNYNLSFHGGTSQYCTGESDRNNTLIDMYNWSITDGGKNCSGQEEQTYFIFQINTTASPQNFSFQVDDANLTVNWGDGNTTDYRGTVLLTHEYATADIYNISVNGTASRIAYDDEWDEDDNDPTPGLLVDILTPLSDGVSGLTSASYMFANTNVTNFTSDTFFDDILSNITDMSYMFVSSPFDHNMSDWDVSNVTTMQGMFAYSPFNQDISAWNVSSVTNMGGMFSNSPFNQSLNSWDVSNVTDMSAMFYLSQFDQNISNWDVSSVETMSSMFYRTWSYFNQDISNWNVSSVTDMSSMFFMSEFDRNISGWDVSSVTDMSHMFYSSLFNQSLNSWDVSNVTTMQSMFAYSKFNQNISAWNVSSVQHMGEMFHSTKLNSQFNQDISNWDVSSVIYMSWMFRESSFNQSIGNWNVSSVTDMSYMFSGSDFNQNISTWSVSNVTNMYQMFYDAPFNQDLSLWDVSSVTNMGGMFEGAPFDQNISSWNVSTVTTFTNMFADAQLSTSNYDALLTGWASLGSLNYNLSFHAGTSQYCTGESDRNDTLIGVYNWSITDAGKNCSLPPQSSSCVNLSDPTTYQDKVVNTTIGYYINDSITLCQDVYHRDSTVIVINNSDLTLDCNGSTLNFSTTTSLGYGINNSFGHNNVSIMNCIITEANGPGAAINIGIYALDADHNTFYNNTISIVSGAYGLALSGNYFNITQNNITTSFWTAYALTLAYVNHSLVHQNTISVEETVSSGILIYGATNTTISNNAVTTQLDNANGLEFSCINNCNLLTVEDNTVTTSGTLSDPISLENFGTVTNCTFDNNTLIATNAGSKAIDIQSNSAVDNTFINNNLSAIGAFTLYDVSTGNNTLIYNSTHAEISWTLSNLTTATDLEINSLVFLEYNLAGLVTSTNNLELNNTATITLKSVSGLTSPTVQRNGQDCGGVCSAVVDLGSNNYQFNVSQFSNYSLASEENDLFIFQINTTASPQNFSFQVDDANLTVNWGDGNTTNYNGTVLLNHTFATAGIYNISVNGTASRIAFSKYYDIYSQEATPELLKDILTPVSDGVTGITSASEMFAFTNITNFTATDFFDITSQNVTDMRYMFYTSQFNQNISDWDVSNVTDTSIMFAYTPFNQSLNGWDVSNVTTMLYMFRDAVDFNQDLSGWDVSRVITMSNMFRNADSFNENISTWNVSNVTDMRFMFFSADSFNQSIGNWDVSNVTQMDGMFSYAISFNQDLDSWDVSSVVDMQQMFKDADAFNNNISTWNVSSVTDMSNMLWGTEFNQSINNWDVSNVTDMSSMFSYSNFNQNISSWNVSSVTDMSRMFEGTPFDQNLSDWNVSSVTDFTNFLLTAELSTTNYDSLLTGWASLALNYNLSFHGGNSQYCAGETARNDTLIDIYNWTITDGGKNCTIPEEPSFFTFQINTTASPQNFSFQVDDAVSLFIDWGDGTNNTYTGTGTFKHEYATENVYNLSLNGTASRISFYEGTPELLIDILTPISNGITGIINAENMFRDTLVSSFTSENFFDDVSGDVTNMNSMFYSSNFNQNISGWDVSSVTYMQSMFFNSQFNQSLNTWNVSNVGNMAGMFSNSPFNQDIGNWNVSSVVDMNAMFSLSPFNQNIGNWDVSSVANMNWMFGASNFNQNISAWNVSGVLYMSYMFYDSVFDQNISAWNVSSVIDMLGMFYSSNFNKNISNWDVSSVTDMSSMFQSSLFNQNISEWDVSTVTDMSLMFSSSSFNQSIANWNVSNVSDMNRMFMSSDFNQDISAWNVSSVENMSFMFTQASDFNQNLSSWDVSGVTDMEQMFYYSDFNQDIGSWDVSSATSMRGMFRGTPFDQNLSDWNVSGVTDFTSMFQSSELSTLNYDSLLTGWASLGSLNYNLSFHGGNSQYCDGESARNDTLIDVYNWTITDGGKNCSTPEESNYFIFQINTTASPQNFSFQVDNSNLTVNWGDGNTTYYNGTVLLTHNYTTAGIYNISLNGSATRISFYEGSADLLIDILTPISDGVTGITSAENMFRETTVVNFTAEDFFDDISRNVTDMRYMFAWSTFNQDISGWNVSAVTDMFAMFSNANDFDQDIGNWDVSNVTDMRYMLGASAFNQDIGDWNLSSIININKLFYNAQSFNQNINTWDISGVTNLEAMFYNANSFNQSLNNWNVSTVTSMNGMFWFANSFNQSLNNWDVSSVTGMDNMFTEASDFNQNISAWNVSSVTTMRAMFYNADSFNQNINDWDVSSVTDMSSMFSLVDSFNQSLNNWNVSSATYMTGMFQSSLFNQDIGDWDVSSVIDMRWMFANCQFDQDIGTWNVSNTTDLANMFQLSELSTLNYDSLLTGWASLGSLNYNLSFHGGDSQYCNGESARNDTLIDFYNWSITDGGKNCSAHPESENYTLNVTIDGVESTTFNQTAHPYEVTIHVENNQVAVENATVALVELYGNNIFAAQTSLALTETLTDENGNATFIIAPTHYPTIENYALEVELIVDGNIEANESFTITNNASLVFTDKYLTPSNLADNSKTTVNSLASIADSLFIWTNTLEQAILLNMTVYSNGTYEGVQTIQTGAPNVINVTLKATNGTPIDGYVTIKEVGGYLMFNPTNNPPNIGAKNHTHEYEEINTTEQFIITPTEYGGIDSNITLTIYNSTDDVVTEINLTVNQSLEPRSGSSYASDELKVIVNSLNSVVNHLYEALN